MNDPETVSEHCPVLAPEQSLAQEVPRYRADAPCYREPDAGRLAAASKKATAAITERALAKDRRRREQYAPAS